MKKNIFELINLLLLEELEKLVVFYILLVFFFIVFVCNFGLFILMVCE